MSVPKNLHASIHQRLLNAAKQSQRPFNDLVMYYAMERFLYRLSVSPDAEQFVLKGGLMLQVWGANATRVTKDIDLLGKLSNDPEHIREVVASICRVTVDDDALVFDPETVVTTRIAEDADYQGVRANFTAMFGKMQLRMQIDFGFSDIVTPNPEKIVYPTVLDHPAAELMAYNRETVIAEKIEAMMKLGEVNTRMKDFFDVALLASGFSYSGVALSTAIAATFKRRETDVEAEPVFLSDRFAKLPDKAVQWKAFLKTARVDQAPAEFSEAMTIIRGLVQPLLEVLARGAPFDRQWPAGGPWSD
jgi:hypothetical protein